MYVYSQENCKNTAKRIVHKNGSYNNTILNRNNNNIDFISHFANTHQQKSWKHSHDIEWDKRQTNNNFD